MRAYLIDPEARTIREVQLVRPDREMIGEMHTLIGCDCMDHATLTDMHDSIWVDDAGLKRGQPVYAFKLPTQKDPFAGKAVVIGADDLGRTRAPHVPIAILRRDVVWLGRIVPDVIWEETERGRRAIVTYSRAR